MRRADSKVFEKMVTLKYQLPKQYAIRGGMGIDVFKRFMDVQEDVMGSNMAKLTWSGGVWIGVSQVCSSSARRSLAA